MPRILFNRVSAQVDMPGAWHDPELLRLPRSREQGARLRERRVPVGLACNDEHGHVHVDQMIDRTQLRGIQAEMPARLALQQRRQDHAGRTEIEAQAVVERFLDRRIDLLEHERVDVEIRRGEQACGTTHRHADETDATPGRIRMQVVHRGEHVEAFAMAECDRIAFALAMIEGEGSSSFARAKALALEDKATMHRLLDVLVEAVARYLAAQAAAGAQALMVFDTWGGLLAPTMFDEFSRRPLAAIVARLKADAATRDVPLILFSKGANAHLEALADSGCDALGVDWTIDLGEARRRVGARVALQGNLDPAVLAASPDTIRSEARKVLDAFGAGHGHVFNLGHGITPDIDPAHVAALVDAVHAWQPNS